MKKLVMHVLLLCAGCYSIRQFTAYKAETDKNNPDVVQYYSTSVEIVPVEFGSPWFSEFTIWFRKDSQGEAWYLKTRRVGKSWLYVQRMQLLVDTVKVDLTSEFYPLRTTQALERSAQVEENTFAVPENFVHRMKNAQSISIRLVGQEFYEKADLTPVDIRNIGWFYDYIVVGALKREPEI